MNPWKENNDRRPTYRSIQAWGNIKGLRDVLNVTEMLFKARLQLPRDVLEAYMESMVDTITQGLAAEHYYHEQLDAIREAEGEDAYLEARKIVEEYKPCK